VPDKLGFDHLVERGTTHHRCIEEGCGYPGYGISLPEVVRRRHHETHERDRRKARERAQKDALARGRKVLAQTRRENDAAYGENGD